MNDSADGVVLRGARTDDARRIAEIDAERHEDGVERVLPLIVEDIERCASGEVQRYVCVAVVKGRVEAFAKCALLPAGRRGDDPELFPIPEGWYLTGIIVDPAQRRRGLGRALTLHRLEWLRPRSDLVYCWVDTINQASIDLHLKLGFEEVARDILISARRNRNRQVLLRRQLS